MTRYSSAAARARVLRGCQVCGRAVTPRSTDGLIPRHRIDAHNPVAAWCPASDTPPQEKP